MAVDSFVPGHEWVPRRQNGVEKWTKRGVNDRQKGGMWPPQVEGNFNSHQFLRCWCLFRWTDDCWNIPPEFCASSKAKMRSQKLAQLTHQPLSARAGRCTPFLSFSGWVYPFLFRDQGGDERFENVSEISRTIHSASTTRFKVQNIICTCRWEEEVDR